MPIRDQKGKSTAWIPLVMTLVLAIGFMTGLKTAKQSDGRLLSISPNKSNASFKVDEVLGFISQRYVDSVDVDAIAEAAIRMIVDSLDPHSHYLDAASVAEYESKMEGRYVGIGIEFRMLRDTLVITDVLPESPAAKADIFRGDKIILVDNDTISGVQMKADRIYQLMKGEKGSIVNVSLLRCKDFISSIPITRGTVRTKSVPTAVSIDDETIAVSIEQFNSNTSREFLDLLEPYHEAGQLKNLVLDLRGNPGGYLQEAVKILNQFFNKKGELLVFTEGLNSKRIEYKTKGKPYLKIEELFVLIDENSASASEIIAGAIQDLDRGTVIGRRSFGKGLVQEQYELSHGGNLRLTIAKYYTPSGRLIQRELGSRMDYDGEFLARAHSGEWTAAADIPRPDSTVYFSSEGDALYGSRGIVPDVFVSIDTQLMADNAYEMFVLKEELGLDLFHSISCSESSFEEIERQLLGLDWRNWIRSFTSFDNFGRLQSVPAHYSTIFSRDIVGIIHRYMDGKSAKYAFDLMSDPFIAEVKNSLVTSPTTQKQLTKVD